MTLSAPGAQSPRSYAVPSVPIAIGDLQGCRDAFDRLLDQIDADDERRIANGETLGRSPLWIAGDLVNRGHDSLGTLRRLIALGDRVISILGNHDLHLLAVAAGVRTMKRGDTIADILGAPDSAALIDWVRHRPMAHFANNMLLVHAGVPPQWDAHTTLRLAGELEAGLRSDDWRTFIARIYAGNGNVWREDLVGDDRLRVIANALTRMRFCNAAGEMEFKANGGLESALPGYMPWFDVPDRSTNDITVIFGHWAALGLITRDRLLGLDSGCVWGHALSARRLTTDPEQRTLFQVPCDTSSAAHSVSHVPEGN
ncbi:symmetrical bis(5'-nucleosyl)-tetraphosphatase [Robbsia sp. KACC 23696]|uniref:symmetrical bis(5'-nucleosyl)-tetraphosphatase n=1 Tax=Robbsia sp. KACC 23696 TaxID=3149231 RepID=UPI00325BF7F5